MKLRNNRGFTLIELVMIIVILGILAAAAVVKYYDLQTDAEEAAIKGIYGNIASAYGIAIASVKTDPAIAAVNARIGGDSGDLTVNNGGVITIVSGANPIIGAKKGGAWTITGDPITDFGVLTVTTY